METVAHVRLRYLPLTETFIYGEITNISAYRVLVFCAQKRNLDRFPHDNIRCISDLNPVEHLWNGLHLQFYAGCPYFSRVISEEGVRLLHAHYGPTGMRMLPLKRKHGIPLLTSFRGMDASLLPTRKPGMYDRLYREGDLFLVRSQDMEDDLVRMGCPQEKVIVHHSGINVDRIQYRKRDPTGEVVFLAVARLSENKGVQYVLRAFAETHDKHKDTRLVVIGDGPYRSKLEAEAKRLGIQGCVEYKGVMPHESVLDEMDGAHIFVLGSFTTDEGEKEGIPNVLMEAQASGMPVVATRHAGIPELVLEERTGLLAGEKDAVGLSECMTRLIEGPETWHRMGKLGRRHVEEEFNVKKQAKKLEDIYSKVMGG